MNACKKRKSALGGWPKALFLAAGMAFTSFGQAADGGQPGREETAGRVQLAEETMKIRIVTGSQELRIVLHDNATARDFAALLPLEVTLTDYNRTEKIADLPKRLSTLDAPKGIDPVVGDIAYYAPWGNLAIFYRDFRYSEGLVRLGRLESGVDELATGNAISVRIERVP